MKNQIAKFSRRHLLAGAGAAALVSVCPMPAVFAQQRIKIRIISNGPDNDALERLMRAQGYLEQAGLDAEYVKVDSPPKNLEGLLKGDAEICPLSGTNPIPNIAQGAPVKIIGSGMKLTGLAVYSNKDSVKSLSDLVGKTVGIGPKNNLLHVVMIAMLRKKKIDENAVNFVEVGSNAQVFQAVRDGKVDAGPSSIAPFYEQAKFGVHSLTDGNAWTEIPEFPYQTMYAPDKAIADNRDGIVRTISAYARLFKYLQAPGSSWEEFSKARVAALPKGDESESRAQWKFGQELKPYGSDVIISNDQFGYVQNLYTSLKIIPAPLPLEKISDMSMARDAMKMLG
jgi:ABC-type nitrate/sulfonate/bicarbonate transport system substrate-binding protein